MLMTDPIIVCPHCKTEIKLTESLAGPLLESTRQQYEKLLNAKDEELTERLKAERAGIAVAEAKKARDAIADELAKAQEEKAASDELAKDRETKLAEARKNELQLRQERQKLQEEKDQFELEKQRAIDAERAKIRETAQKDADEQARLKIAEKDKTITDLQSKLQDALRKAEQGSQQLQGEVLELSIEDELRQLFPHDSITPVPKGVHGGDLLQIVRDASGECGRILWESKRTKAWSDGWLPKLRDDQRAAKAQLSILVSMELPPDLRTFRHIDGVWVTSITCAIGVASILRAGLMDVAAARRSIEGRNDKMELLYCYLSGPEFRHRIEGIVEAFVTLREELEAEKRSTLRMWAKREKQLDRAVAQTAGMYGELSGIIGASLPEIDQLNRPSLTGPEADGDESSRA